MALFALGVFASLLLAVGLFVLLRGKKARPAPARDENREAKEKELRDRLERVRDWRKRAAKAIADDPKRAARVVRKMMKGKD